MPDHVHLIVVPQDEDGLRKTVANAHRKYASRINSRNKWTGHLWQGRYGSVVMDEQHLYHAFAYVALNPVRAGLVKRAQNWRWSSVHAHLGKEDGITNTEAAKSGLEISRNFSRRISMMQVSTRCAPASKWEDRLGHQSFLSV